MKKEWRKEEKEYYLSKNKPVLIDIPTMNFFVIDGKGDPNTSKEFSDAIEALYSLSYTVKMLPKKGITPKGYYDYTVYPLEGKWSFSTPPKDNEKLDKNNFVYSLMIRQPDFVDETLAKEIIEKTKFKKELKILEKVRFETFTEGLSVQMMHIGSYDEEKKSFLEMEKFCQDNNLTRISFEHREIYLSDPRKVEENKRRTLLRFQVKKN